MDQEYLNLTLSQLGSPKYSKEATSEKLNRGHETREQTSESEE